MKLKVRLLITLFISLFCLFMLTLCIEASDIRYEYSANDPNYHSIIINGQSVGKQPHRAETDATCITLARCYDCKAQFGDYASHNFMDATCTNPKTCSFCDYQEGDPISHSGGQAECMAQAKCEYCGIDYGDPLGHTGGEATCTEKAKCDRCGEEYGKTLPHTGGVANCQTAAICTVCATVYGELGEHTVSEEWIIEKEFHYQICSIKGCSEVFNDGDHTDETKDGKCDTCNVKYKLSQTEIILIISGSTVLVIAIGLGTLVIFDKKNKRK